MTAVGEILELAYGKALKESDRDGGNIPVVGSGGVVGGHSVGITDSPTIVVGRKGSIGNVTWIDDAAWPIDTAYFVKLKHDDIDPRWAYWMLKSLPLSRMNKSAAVPGLNRDDVYRIDVAVPSIREQRRIAAILDRAENICDLREIVLGKLDVLRESLFDSMFGLPSTWGLRWDEVAIGEVAASVDYGTAAKAGATGSFPILRMGNVTDEGRIDTSDLKYLDLGPKEIDRFTTRRGDLLFNRTNSVEKVGKTGLVRADDVYAIAGYLVRIRLTENAHPEFVCAFLNGAQGRRIRRRLAKEAINQANISAGELRRIRMPLPPIELQNEFGRIVGAIEAQRECVLSLAKQDRCLFSSLQSRAFRGEL